MSSSCGGCCTDSCDSSVSEETPVDIDASFVSEFNVPKMDCPSEERMIRMALEDLNPAVALDFDIPNRLVKVFHRDNLTEISQRLEALNYGAVLNNTQDIDASHYDQTIESVKLVDKKEAKILIWLLVINAVMFVTELTVGLIAQSAGLIADSLDMFADAAVYGIALYAVGRSSQLKHRAAHISGWLQVILALGVLSEVARRFIYGSEPISELMMAFGFIALIANVWCLMLIFKSKDSGTHMKASWIFSANDVIANVGVILAGVLVAVTGSAYPDLIIGLIIGLIVLNGARRILQLK